MTITIPPVVINAVAKSEYTRACKRGSREWPAWEDLEPHRQKLWLDDAHAACLAMLEAWPGMEVFSIMSDGEESILLPITENSNERE